MMQTESRLQDVNRQGWTLVPRPLRFLAVGLLNTIFTFAVYSGLIIAHFALYAALAISTVVGIFFNYRTTGRLVFENHSWARLPRFLLTYAVLYALNVLLVTVIRQRVGGQIAAQAILALPISGLAFITLRRFVFAQKA